MPRQPYLYDGAGQNRTGRFPEPKFDPKAITRASWEPKDLKPQLTGPFVTFSRHPDARLVLSHRSNDYVSLSPKTKGWIKVVRIVQLCLRILQFVTAAGILALLVLLNYMEALVGWVMRITAGIAIIHCLYAMYHLSRPARGRSPASSTAYQLFAGLSDVGVVALFAYGALSPQKNSAAWSTRWIEQNLVSHFVLALHYTFTEASVLHVVSAAMSAWLGFMFLQNG
ncbi:hypothetical protein Cob_v004671 [Colletotrichum orbiculare MAFF 240422]|uniref:Uncharacterized protein n=1 Tax=Colletotrichum orbiculare (strain 104-T / ATCC 96160 / CBS 514.97 / LARS 414 / MAFF 240422) TaxID=1213857 RepID=A0A484FX71_COLOR|nr:hypothetical protein Cob_v004671 [Colletotrichum orbiculare MAFF 240422]